MTDSLNQNSLPGSPMNEGVPTTESPLTSLKMEQTTFTADHSTQFPPPQGQSKYIVFTLGDTRYAVPIGQVIEVSELEHLTPVPNAPEWVLGVTNLHGDVVSVVDCSSFLEQPTTLRPEANNVCVVRNKEKNLTTSLLVDEIEGLTNLHSDALTVPENQLVERIVPFVWNANAPDGQAMKIINLEGLLSSMTLS